MLMMMMSRVMMGGRRAPWFERRLHCMCAAINSSFLSWSSSPSWVSCPSSPAWRRVAVRPFSRRRNQHCLFAFDSDRTCSSCTFRTDGHSATGSIPHDTTRHTHGTRSTMRTAPSPPVWPFLGFGRRPTIPVCPSLRSWFPWGRGAVPGTKRRGC